MTHKAYNWKQQSQASICDKMGERTSWLFNELLGDLFNDSLIKRVTCFIPVRVTYFSSEWICVFQWIGTEMMTKWFNEMKWFNDKVTDFSPPTGVSM